MRFIGKKNEYITIEERGDRLVASYVRQTGLGSPTLVVEETVVVDERAATLAFGFQTWEYTGGGHFCHVMLTPEERDTLKRLIYTIRTLSDFERIREFFRQRC